MSQQYPTISRSTRTKIESNFPARAILARQQSHLEKRGTKEAGKSDLLSLSAEKESKSTYSIEYLLKISKAAGSATDTINFEYSSKMPFRLEFRLGKNGRIHFYSAPRVTE